MTRPSLSELEHSQEFLGRHIGPTPAQQAEMARTLGFDSLEALIDATVPARIRNQAPMDLAAPQTEQAVLARLRAIAGKNRVLKSYIGTGYHDTYTPAVIQRNVLENPGWYTAYTPYQPEISQGRLEALLTFQQAIMDLTGMELANASMLDEGTAAAEAMTLLQRVNKKNRSSTFIVAEDCHPQTIAVVRTRAEALDINVVVGDPAQLAGSTEAFGLLLQYPGTYGHVRDLEPLIARAHDAGTLVTVAADLMSLLLLKSPGAQGADVVVGNSQRFGVPMGFGGPHAAFFATRDAFKRSTPGRIIGVSIDRHGNEALRMAMQTREQHIRREKATSNICTAQALLSIMAAFYAMYHGPVGLRRIAERIHYLTAVLASGLQAAGLPADNDAYFDTLTISVGDRQQAILQRALDAGMNLRIIGTHTLGIALDETTTAEDVDRLLAVMTGKEPANPCREQPAPASGIPQPLQRAVDYLQHPLFNDYHSETEMLRYMRRLESRDIALNQAMIPLGSCTMKLNATTEMLPVTWQEFAGIHPFAPADQTEGYRELLAELEHMLKECTGYDAISLQPNAGSQGEYAGLLAIRRYHESRGDDQRDVCLIPSSAHGTNPASAALAGMRVVIVECDADGNVDLDDLSARAEQYSNELAAIMITYPSTHGVFEETVVDVCDIVHRHGGQVYVDGANLNALVGLASPGKFGADVSHLNLHKTFCIPHGGGGPGMGPIGVGAHLQPFLPSHPVVPVPGLPESNDVVSAAPWGSASILPISWAYIALMGAEGLTQATRVAILSANYIAHRLKDHYPVLYTGRNGTVAHECIVDIRPLKEASGISEEDIAKRLVDFGFHAPTMSFPVAGTLMIEPTESESLAELDRFCDAMIAIREEIRAVEEGRLDAEDNPLRNAPHTLLDVTAERWDHAYTREQAAYPLPSLRQRKYWPPVNRVDNVYGDRNLVCSCPSIDAYREPVGV
ncbi:MAG: glycine dehydrogenase (aminomethyl-transferring) [Haliea sp.]|uniref:aminomethyl-transferring glycine dehydrogenase n=1 Tax=Haliea sp. TaxID=1932666 RepID=UPI000C601F4E|nr:aminomethyl-transferring glycine dehydrogenase [Haliea sp.]MBM70450.1 glycine dehydrogenase (aminomethyl-transferring) [Haliea sp.]|tara:strand:- start:102988 stop:105879 length:2892 start_codon:yes stop_codon:yes gene_type:complete